MKTITQLVTFLFSALCLHSAIAEPYIAVSKGLQCSACHSTTGGGGLRTPYGNSYAQMEMPVERIGNADTPLWTGQPVDRVAVGGNFRAEYRYIDTPNTPSASAFEVTRGTLYGEVSLIRDRLSVYVDQQVAPGASLNRETYVRLKSADQTWTFLAGQFFLPYGLRLQDDTAFVRMATGVNFTLPDRGVQVGYEKGPWSVQTSVTNGAGGGAETDQGKQTSMLAQFVQPVWRLGASANHNNSSLGDRTMYGAFTGIKTGPIAWLAEADMITDEVSGSPDLDSAAALLEANWLYRKGHNIKASYDYYDPDRDTDDDQQARYSLLWEYTPIQFLQTRVGARVYDGVTAVDTQNREEYFVELHGFF